jgi:hypothetical protein
LVPHRIPQIAEVSFEREVMVSNSSNATYVRDSEGRRWVRRDVALMGDNGVQAETLWWLLADHLHIPVPEVAIHCDPSDEGWLSRRIDEVVHWRPSRASYVINMNELGSILALDAVTGNHDRHKRNLLLETLSESRMRAWAIDAANAAIGCAADVEQPGLDVPKPHPDTTGIPIDLVTPGALATAGILETMARAPSAGLAQFVAEACHFGKAGPSERERLLHALCARCAVASDLTTGYLSKLGSLTP